MNKADETTLQERIFTVTENDFSAAALAVFQFQYEENKVYRSYCDLLKIDPSAILSLAQIPFLPIQLFKTKEIISGAFEPQVVFESSGTTGSINSRHLVKEKSLYEESFLRSFRSFYGDEKDLCILGLLPSYLERQHSSLVYMVQELITRSENKNSGFYLFDLDALQKVIRENEAAGQKTLLIGVTYALIDLAEKFSMLFTHTIVMETGGMKGKREELSRKAVHDILKNAFGLQEIHSEYGMTELLSQAYSAGEGIFSAPPWLRICIRSEDDPFEITDRENMQAPFKTGAVNIIDLANIYSCAFIATDDAGKLYADGRFEISGRLDNSDIRGCGLMIF